MANVLVLGGTGFIGRNLVEYLLADESRCATIRVCDKTPPALAFMTPKQIQMYKENPKVEFIQCDLTKDAHVSKAFACPEESRSSFQFVFNLCGETRFGLPSNDYHSRIVESADKCGRAAAACGAKWIELSTATLYKSSSAPCTESATVQPWTLQGQYRLEAEKVLSAIDGLPLVILRPAMVYGCGDLTSLTPRLSTAASYKFIKEKMKCLWDKSLAINCVHVEDVCAALWCAATQLQPGTIVNLADQSNLTQGVLNAMLEDTFDIETGFHGKILSNLAKLNFASVVESANQKHVPAWQKLCAAHGISTTPISPFLDATLLGNNNLLVDGSKITAMTGFEYKHPRITKQLLDEQLRYFVGLGIFPDVARK